MNLKFQHNYWIKYIIIHLFFSGDAANRASALLCSTLFNNDLLHLKGKQEFKNLTYFHAHVLNRTVLTLQNVLKYSNQKSNILPLYDKSAERDSSGSSMQSEEQFVEMLNDDVFFLLLQDMVLQRSNEEVRQTSIFSFFLSSFLSCLLHFFFSFCPSFHSFSFTGLQNYFVNYSSIYYSSID